MQSADGSSNTESDQFVFIDATFDLPDLASEDESYNLPVGYFDLVANDGVVWVSVPNERRVYRFEADQTSVITFEGAPEHLLIAEQTVFVSVPIGPAVHDRRWSTSDQSGTVAELDLPGTSISRSHDLQLDPWRLVSIPQGVLVLPASGQHPTPRGVTSGSVVVDAWTATASGGACVSVDGTRLLALPTFVAPHLLEERVYDDWPSRSGRSAYVYTNDRECVWTQDDRVLLSEGGVLSSSLEIAAQSTPRWSSATRLGTTIYAVVEGEVTLFEPASTSFVPLSRPISLLNRGAAVDVVADGQILVVTFSDAQNSRFFTRLAPDDARRQLHAPGGDQ